MKLRTILLGKWSWKRPLYSLASIYLLLAAFAYFFADLIIFQPPPPSYGEDLNQLRFIPDGRGGRIALIYDPPSPGQPTLLWSHGNAEDLGNIQPILNTLEDLGYGLLAYDYPGYGLSDGKPSEESVYRAAEAAYHYLRDELGTDPDKIFLCGQSVGSGPTCHLAARVPHRAVVLLAPFHTAYQVATRIPLFPGDRFPNGDNLAQVDTPLIIIHGIDDRIIPISQGIKLYHRSPSKKKYFLPIEDSGHNELYVVGSWRVFTAIRFILNESSEAPESAFP